MAKATLDFRDLDDDLIPDVCAKCGSTATLRKPTDFTWRPPWVAILIFFGLWPYILVSLILTKRRKVIVPFCEDHKNHWTWRTIAVLSSFAGVGLMGTGAAILFANGDSNYKPNPLAGILCLATLLLLAAWVVATIVIQYTAIRPTEITDESITLRNVALDFVAACEKSMEDDYNRSVRDEWRQPEHRRAADPGNSIRKPKRPRPPTDAIEPE